MFHYGSVKFSSSTVFILQIFRIFHLSPLYGVNVCSNFLAFYVHLSHKIMPFSLVIWCLKAFHWMNEWGSMKEREWICFLSSSFLCIFVMGRGYTYLRMNCGIWGILSVWYLTDDSSNSSLCQTNTLAYCHTYGFNIMRFSFVFFLVSKLKWGWIF